MFFVICKDISDTERANRREQPFGYIRCLELAIKGTSLEEGEYRTRIYLIEECVDQSPLHLRSCQLTERFVPGAISRPPLRPVRVATYGSCGDSREPPSELSIDSRMAPGFLMTSAAGGELVNRSISLNTVRSPRTWVQSRPRAREA